MFSNVFVFWSRKWFLTTLLVIVASLVMVRLGIWQLDRLEQRRAFNQRVLEQTQREPLQLSASTLEEDLFAMEYRQVEVTGEYDHVGEIALRNQVWRDQYGVHLVTPLKIQGSDWYILVDRGWIPGDEFEAGLAKGNWDQFNEPGTITVRGVIRRPQSKPDFGRISDPQPAPGEDRLLAWNLLNIEAIQKQTSYPLLPVYIQQAPEAEWTGLPYRSEPDLELTEGPHMGYAIQWFSFALILLFGYPFYVMKEERRRETHSENPAEAHSPVTGD